MKKLTKKLSILNAYIDFSISKVSNFRERLKELLPLEKTLNEARQIENIHKLIKNSGSFELTKEQMELANILV